MATPPDRMIKRTKSFNTTPNCLYDDIDEVCSVTATKSGQDLTGVTPDKFKNKRIIYPNNCTDKKGIHKNMTHEHRLSRIIRQNHDNRKGERNWITTNTCYTCMCPLQGTVSLHHYPFLALCHKSCHGNLCAL